MANYIFPAIFTQEDSGYFVSFPDLESCYTQGDNLQEAYDMAQDVLALTLYRLEEDSQSIPTPSNPKDVNTEAQSFVSLVSCDTIEYRKFYNNKAVKKTLSIPEWLNTMAEKNDINFSATLQKALKKELNLQ